MNKLLLLVLVLAGWQMIHAQPIQYRLASTGTYACDSAHNYHITDSATYNYSNGRGSDMKTGIYLYDSLVKYRLSGTTLTPAQLYYRTYGDSNRIITQGYAKRNGGGWQNVSRNIYAYFTNILYDSTITDGWDSVANNWQSNHRYKYYYTGNRLDSILWRKNLSGTWVPEARELNSYASGNLVAHNLLVWDDSTANWDSVQYQTYSYDTLSRLVEYTLYNYDPIAAMLVPIARENYDHDAKGRITEHTYSSWSDLFGRWDGNYQHFYSYLNNDKTDVEIVNQWDIIAQMWGPYKRRQYNYDARQSLTYILEKAFSGWTYLNSVYETWYYNADNLPVAHNLYSWNDGANKWEPMAGEGVQMFYHYEAIPDVIATIEKHSSTGMKIYPNPASAGFVTVDILWQDELPFTIKMYDMQGRLVQQTEEKASLNYKHTISLTGMMPGTYLITADNGNEEMTNRLFIGNQ